MLRSLRRGRNDIRRQSWNVDPLDFVVVAGRYDLYTVSRSATLKRELLPQ